ncbi:GntR family transcriptional regulator [Microbacterium sp. TNHR37B]|uniref:GntR family transcriptional regulator n=1 Tax=Microbacterium sp. TNHR37B TaxID=1775956 RepID=UPI0007B2CC45|nr:GntR family transcriptional regulator [Microbacterium sp. TNHR37B]KZE88408.1 putative HTH-type transcriptional regulator [Microbacterium sp. TNHR37B]
MDDDDVLTPRRRVLADEVFRRIGGAIVRGELAEGDRLRDQELADRFNVSRMPVREALLRLERVGLVEIEPSRFTRVTVVDAATVRQHLELAGYAAGIAARMAVQRASPSALAHAVSLADRLIDALDDPAAASLARWQLFSTLSEHSGNSAHHALMVEVELALGRSLSRSALLPDEPRREHALCVEIRDALAARSPTIENLIRRLHGIE